MCCFLENNGLEWGKVVKEVTAMLLGYSKRSIDAKGRIVLSRDFRREFEGGLYITKGLDDCLLLFTLTEWDRIAARIEEMPSGREETRRFTRLFFSNADRLVPDGQGRILVPQHLREMADLQDEAVIVGLGNKAEIWDPARWEKYNEESRDTYEQAAQDIGI